MTADGQPARAPPRREGMPDPREVALGLRNYYAGVVDEPLEPRMTELLARLDRVAPLRGAAAPAEGGRGG